MLVLSSFTATDLTWNGKHRFICQNRSFGCLTFFHSVVDRLDPQGSTEWRTLTDEFSLRSFQLTERWSVEFSIAMACRRSSLWSRKSIDRLKHHSQWRYPWAIEAKEREDSLVFIDPSNAPFDRVSVENCFSHRITAFANDSTSFSLWKITENHWRERRVTLCLRVPKSLQWRRSFH